MSGRASALGSSTSTPPCIIGAVIMKMISSTNTTSTSEVTLMSALSGISPPPPEPAAEAAGHLEQPLPGHRADQLVGEALELPGEHRRPGRRTVVGDHRRDRRRQAGDGGRPAPRPRPAPPRPMLPEPFVEMPMNASMMPSTVPSRPSSGLTEPIVASQGM